MIVATLLATGSIVIGLLGLVHLIYTLLTNKFEPRDSDLGRRLREVSPVLTAETTMWRAWIGFNASHSLGAILFAALYFYLAIFNLEFLLSTPFLVILSLLVLGSYLILAYRFWFKLPLWGIAIAATLFVAGYVVAFS